MAELQETPSIVKESVIVGCDVFATVQPADAAASQFSRRTNFGNGRKESRRSLPPPKRQQRLTTKSNHSTCANEKRSNSIPFRSKSMQMKSSPVRHDAHFAKSLYAKGGRAAEAAAQDSGTADAQIIKTEEQTTSSPLRSVSMRIPMRLRANQYLQRSWSLGRVDRAIAHDSETANTDIELGFFGQLYRQASIRSILPVIYKIKETKSRKWTVAIFSFIASLLAILRGFTLSFSSNTTLDLQGEAEELPSHYLFSTTLISIFTALSQVGALIGGPVGGFIADRYGRKCAMLFSGLPYVIGYMTISNAYFSQTEITFKALLLIGRFISGVGMGWASAVVSVYIAEISPVKLRGVFGSLTEIMLTIGIIFNYSVGSIEHFPYYHVALVAVGIVTVFELFMVWLPDTPRSLVSHGQLKKAEHTLNILRGEDYDIESELSEIKQSIIDSKKRGRSGVWRQFKDKRVLVPFIYLLIIMFFTQAGGISAVASYAATIFSDAGISNPRVTAIYAVGVASLIGNFVAFFTVDLLGRKVLLILSGMGMMIGSIMLGTHFFITRSSLCEATNSTSTEYYIEEPCNLQYAPLAIVSLVLFRFSYSIGWGGIPWLLISELLPLSVRGLASGFATLLTSGTAAVVSGVFLMYSELVQPWFALWTFTLINLTAVIFVIVFIPETKGKSLEELEKQFERLDPLHCVSSVPLHCCSLVDKEKSNKSNEIP